MIDPNAPLIPCAHCEEGRVPCEECQGRRYTISLVRGYGGIAEECEECDEDGFVSCEHCDGQGEVEDPGAELVEEESP